MIDCFVLSVCHFNVFSELAYTASHLSAPYLSISVSIVRLDAKIDGNILEKRRQIAHFVFCYIRAVCSFVRAVVKCVFPSLANCVTVLIEKYIYSYTLVKTFIFTYSIYLLYFYLQREINLTIISPRKIPALQKLYEAVSTFFFQF